MGTRLGDIISWCVNKSNVGSVTGHESPVNVSKTRLLRQARCISSLVRCSKLQESVIPPLKWRNRHGKQVSIGREGAEALCESLMRQLKEESARGTSVSLGSLTLDIRGLRIEDDGIRALSPLFTHYNKLVALLLPGNNITDDGVAALLTSLSERTQPLKRLSLLDNPVTVTGVLSVLDFFCEPTHMPMELMLCRTKKREDTDQKESDYHLVLHMVDKLIAMLHSDMNGILTSFTYHGSGCTDFNAMGFESFLHVAITQSALEHLALHDCYNSVAEKRADRHEVETLATPFKVAAEGLCASYSALRSLELHIPLSETAVSALAKGIAGAAHLCKLNLRGCDMSLNSIRLIGDSLSTNNTLLFLDLSYQSAEIAHPLSGNKWKGWATVERMKSYLVSSCRPLLPVFKSLHQNKTLQYLAVVGIDIVNDDVEELCACIERSGNCVIRHVHHTDVGSMPLTTKLDNLLTRNRSIAHKKNIFRSIT